VLERRTPLTLPHAFGFLLEDHRYKICYGGRGSAKSRSYARALIARAAESPVRILCAREFQISIADSVHSLLADQIESLELGYRFTVQKSTILCDNGSEFIFAGIRTNVTKIKSVERLGIVWVEEAESVSARSWEVLIPTLREPGSEIWITFNPHEETDPTYQRFVVHAPPGSVVVRVTWRDNPWFPIELERERAYLYANDPEAAAHVWGGETRRISGANVLRGRYVVEPFEPRAEWAGPYLGADWGFATDPTALVKLWVDEKADGGPVLYIEHEAYAVGCEIDATPALFDKVPGARKLTIRADSARPETISYLQRHGYPLITAAIKGPGSIEDGVEHLRSYRKIVIHSRCTHAADEARLWCYKTDRLTGDVLPELVDRNNNVFDAARYGLEPIIRARGGLLDFISEEKAKQEKGAGN